MDNRYWQGDPMSNDSPRLRGIGSVVANVALSAIVGAASAFGVLAVAGTDTGIGSQVVSRDDADSPTYEVLAIASLAHEPAR